MNGNPLGLVSRVGLAARIMLATLDGDTDQARRLIDNDQAAAVDALMVTLFGYLSVLYGSSQSIRDHLALTAIAGDLDDIAANVLPGEGIGGPK